jgi:hypothetical protein
MPLCLSKCYIIPLRERAITWRELSSPPEAVGNSSNSTTGTLTWLIALRIHLSLLRLRHCSVLVLHLQQPADQLVA